MKAFMILNIPVGPYVLRVWPTISLQTGKQTGCIAINFGEGWAVAL